MTSNISFPTTRLRRPRLHDWSRRLVSENSLSVDDLILPIFVHEKDFSEEIIAMPGVYRHSIKDAVEKVTLAASLEIPAVAFFPTTPPQLKSADAKESLNPNNLVCRVLREAKRLGLGIGLLADVALDPYTSHGHDGFLDEDGTVLNDETVEMLCKQAVVQANAGCDIVCPSDMMDGRVGMIRKRLDAEGFSNVMIMSYAAKYASAFYGPFREAIGSSTLIGKDAARGYRDKSGYQMDMRNSQEAIREVLLDITEGADFVIVKPGMPYLDIVYRVKHELNFPTFAYQVSGEYSMIVDSSNLGRIDRKKAIFESLLAFKRSGADGILTYFAIEVAEAMRL